MESLKNPKEESTEPTRRDFLKYIMAAAGGLATAGLEPIFSQERELIVGHTKGTRERLASKRERQAFKIVTLDEILETIRKTQKEHAYFRTNENKKGEYVQCPTEGTSANIYIDSDNFPLDAGVKELVIAHTHRIDGSIREQFRTMPPFPYSFRDLELTEYQTRHFAKKNIKASTEVIEQTGIWSVEFAKTEKTQQMLDFFRKERYMHAAAFPGDGGFSSSVRYQYLIYRLRVLDTDSPEFKKLLSYKNLHDIVKACQEINTKLKEKFPEVYKDTKSILEIHTKLWETADTNDLWKRKALAEEYAQIVLPYGFTMKYEPFVLPPEDN